MINKKVAEFISISPTRSWDLERLRSVVVSFDYEIIRGIPINRDLNDKLIWHYDRTGESYSVKSGYKLYMKIKIDGISSSSSL